MNQTLSLEEGTNMQQQGIAKIVGTFGKQVLMVVGGQCYWKEEREYVRCNLKEEEYMINHYLLQGQPFPVRDEVWHYH